ncbi:10392_t:CDS:2 [Scutellospora calospora]|uniref:10392_t:CDS:1 n=1 Tax=Scutellospora calospora TaxID=85575 RepID=A0ACA9JZS1_9GLOM|nr:10392_t:CDS:2 [Scutellospora calospora]
MSSDRKVMPLMKYGAFSVASLLLIVYFGILIHNVITDRPILQTSYDDSKDDIPIPDLVFSSSNEFSIGQCIYTLANDRKPVKEIPLLHASNNMYFEELNITLNFSNNIDLAVAMFDEELNLVNIEVNNYDRYVQSFAYQNFYFLLPGLEYQITFSRSLIQIMKPSWIIASAFGIPPQHENYYYLTKQFVNTSNFTKNNTKVSIYLQSSVVITQKEISAIGSFGGLWTLLASIYSFTFGSTIIESIKNIFGKGRPNSSHHNSG